MSSCWSFLCNIRFVPSFSCSQCCNLHPPPHALACLPSCCFPAVGRADKNLKLPRNGLVCNTIVCLLCLQSFELGGQAPSKVYRHFWLTQGLLYGCWSCGDLSRGAHYRLWAWENLHYSILEVAENSKAGCWKIKGCFRKCLLLTFFRMCSPQYVYCDGTNTSILCLSLLFLQYFP